MLWIKAWHIIAMVAWFAGLFYLPRLFVYHVETSDAISLARFKVMEWRLYYAIMWPAGILTTLFGFWLTLVYMPYTLHMAYLQAKLALVALVWIHHLACGHYVHVLQVGQTKRSSVFFRVFNEIPTVLLIAIVLLVVIKPTLRYY